MTHRPNKQLQRPNTLRFAPGIGRLSLGVRAQRTLNMHKSVAFSLVLALVHEQATAGEPDSAALESQSEPVKCYVTAWGSKADPLGKPGLGLNSGQAVNLCSGTNSASKTIECFIEAWAHPDDGGLGLPAGLAINLCKSKPE